MRGFNRLEEPGGGAGLRRTGAGGAGFSDRVGVGGREVPLMTPIGDGNTADTNICQIKLDKHLSWAAKVHTTIPSSLLNTMYVPSFLNSLNLTSSYPEATLVFILTHPGGEDQ